MRQVALRAPLLCTLTAALAISAIAQSNPLRPDTADPNVNSNSSGEASGMEEVRRQLREQREEIERLQATLQEQGRLVDELRRRIDRAEQTATSIPTKDGPRPAGTEAALAAAVPTSSESASKATPAGQMEERLSRVEGQSKKTSEALAKQLGSITFSGDIRLRYESFYGQLNALANAANPAIIGNPLTTRQRLRIRGRFAIRGQVGKEFDWGLRLSTGSFPDVTSTNQTLTDFFSHKIFSLDQVYLTYKPAAVPGLQVQGGKFEPPWLRTEMTIDTDIQTEGLNQVYTRSFKKSALKTLTFVAWQLPFLERPSAFVLDSGGKFSPDQSGRAGRDMALYGAQLRAP